MRFGVVRGATVDILHPLTIRVMPYPLIEHLIHQKPIYCSENEGLPYAEKGEVLDGPPSL